jgi:starch phosphorylase
LATKIATVRTIYPYTVVPTLPPRLERLRTLAYNGWWSWNPEAEELFARLDPDIWAATHRNPVALLGRLPQRHLERFAEDEAFVGLLDEVWESFHSHLSDPGWFGRRYPQSRLCVAYFSMEYGLSDCFPIYSGGLGVLSGDHLKSASDLGLPLVGVGLAYTEGYFRQALNTDGWQTERYPVNDWSTMPVEIMTGPHGEDDSRELRVAVELPTGPVVARILRIQVGRVPLYLLDTHLEKNRPEDRLITSRLYVGDREMRIKQELLLGVGGMRALTLLGVRPTVCHMNEGHSAFLALERIRQLMEQSKLDFGAAREAAAASTAFTTHTPVPAGNDEFTLELVDHQLRPLRESLGLTSEQLLTLGRTATDGRADSAPARFSMAVLALKLSTHHNAVSKLHATVSRAMWQPLWPELATQEVPIDAITNGIHTRSWVSPEVASLYDRYLGRPWRDDPSNAATWARVETVPGLELWRTRCRLREQLVAFVRQHLRLQAERRGASSAELAEAEEALDPDALTLGFARRFATYKRANLLFRDLDRLARIINDSRRPVQFIFAGKAHPNDEEGKRLVREVVQTAHRPELRGRIVFLPDYDIRIARAMVGGVDVWLNCPRRPYEASGTSGMKAAANGVLNLSVLDGWWPEAWTPELGWAIGRGEENPDPNAQDEADARDLYEQLEHDVAPLFFDRDRNDMPRGWIAKVKRTVATLAPQFSTHRMVQEYCERVYLPASERGQQLAAEGYRGARELERWKVSVAAAWHEVKLVRVQTQGPLQLPVGGELHVEALVQLGSLGPLAKGGIAVELCYGLLGGAHRTDRLSAVATCYAGTTPEGLHRFVGVLPCGEAGAHGFSVRVLPTNPALTQRFETGLVRWG